MRKDYMSYLWRMWGKRDIQRHDKREAMYYHKAGSLSVSCKSCEDMFMGRKVVFVSGICGLFNINVLN